MRLLVVGFDNPYQVESIDGDDYMVMQKVKNYKYRMKVKKNKLRKL